VWTTTSCKWLHLEQNESKNKWRNIQIELVGRKLWAISHAKRSTISLFKG
jgi:hypothetical protein